MSEHRLTWSEFKERVYAFLPEEASRQNVGLPARSFSEALFDLHLKAAVRNIQHYVPHYRISHETVFHASDFVLEGYAGRAVLPPGAELKDFWLCARVDDNTTDRRQLIPVSWSKRFDLVHNNVNYADGVGVVCIDHEGYTFYVAPYPLDCHVVSVFWNGKKTDFEETEETPFDDDVAAAVASYVESHIRRAVDKDLSLANAAMADFVSKRTQLFVTGKNRTNPRP